MLLMFRLFPLLAGGTVLVVSGLVHGLWTDRWTVSPALQDSAAHLDTLPLKLGDWEGTPQELDARQLAVAEATGHVARRYVQRRTGAEVSVVILSGRPGPLSVHRPEVCYAGSGFVQMGSVEKWQAPKDSAARGTGYWSARFTQPGADPQPLRVVWAWSASGDWAAADNPRLAFVREPVLYKLYVVRRMARADETLDKDPTIDFLNALVPAFRRCLEGPPADVAPTDHLVARSSS